MRKSLILFALLFAYVCSAGIWGCASSDDEDKYPLITKSERKKIKSICRCMEPLSPLLVKMMEAKDSATALLYEDSLGLKANDMKECFDKLDTIDFKTNYNDKKYTEQLIAYIKDKHPDCVPFMLGREGYFEERNKNK